MHRNVDLFLTFSKISMVAFGGGYSILPLLDRELVDKKGWMSQDDLGDIFAIAQCTPGVISVNAATYVGTQTGGLWGAVFATLGILTPPVIIICLIAAFFWPYLSNPWVQHALMGLQVCVCALILKASIRLFGAAVLDVPSLCIFLCALVLSFFTTISPAFLVIAAGLAGFGLQWRKGGRRT